MRTRDAQRKARLLLVASVLLGSAAFAASTSEKHPTQLRQAGPTAESSQSDLPAGAVAKLGVPARFVGAQWYFGPVAHDRAMSQLAYVDMQREVVVEAVATSQRHKRLDASAGLASRLEMSRDGKTLTVRTEEGKKYLIDIANDGKVTVMDPEQLAATQRPRLLAVSANEDYETRLGDDCVEVHRSGSEGPIACLHVEFEPPPSPPGVNVCYSPAPYSSAFSPDSTKLAVWRSSSKLLVYDLQSRKELRLETLDDQIATASFSPNSSEIYLTHSRDGNSVKRWSVDDGRPLSTIAIDSGRRSIPGRSWLSPYGRVLIAQHYWGVAAWRPGTGQLLWQFETGAEEIRWLDFSSDGRTFLTLSGSQPGLLELRDTRSGAPIPNIVGHQEHVTSLAFSPDGSYLVSTDVKGTSIAWEAENQRAISRIAAPWNRQGSYPSVAGKTIWISTAGIDDISIQSYGKIGEPRLLRGAGGDLGAIALSGDERDVAVLNEQQDRLCVWSVVNTVLRWCTQIDKPSNRSINFADLQFSGDDSVVAALSETGEILRWRGDDGVPLAPVDLTTDTQTSHASAAAGFSITSHRIAGDNDSCVSWLVEDDSTGETLFSSSRRRNFFSGFVKLPSLACSFTPDRRLAVVFGTDRQITVRGTATGEPLAVLSGHASAITTFAISPDGSLLATAGTDHVIYLWDLTRYH